MTQTIWPVGAKPITGALAGTELVVVDNGYSIINTVTTRQIAALALVQDNAVITALNTVGAGTVTAAGIVGQITQRGGAQSATAFTDTTDTAAAIIAALPAGLTTGTSFLWTYENNTDGDATLAAGATVTLTGNVIVPKLKWAQYLVTKTSATAVSIVFVTSGDQVPLPYAQFTTTALEGLTITVAGITGAQICNVINTGTTPASLNLPTAAQIVAAIPNAKVGLTYMLNYRNGSGSANTATLTTNTGLTLTGTMTIAQNVTRTFQVTLTSLTAVTFQSMGVSAAAA